MSLPQGLSPPLPLPAHPQSLSRHLSIYMSAVVLTMLQLFIMSLSHQFPPPAVGSPGSASALIHLCDLVHFVGAELFNEWLSRG